MLFRSSCGSSSVVRVRLDRKATSISLLVVLGADGQKVLLAIKSMGGESAEAWRSMLDGLIRCGRWVSRRNGSQHWSKRSWKNADPFMHHKPEVSDTQLAIS